MTQILIVDEDTDVLRLLRIKLNGAGYDILRARDGAEALAHAAEQRPDLVVIEQLLPDMSGLELLESIEAILGPAAPVIVLSAESDDETIAALLSAGAADYVIKPFSPQALLERIRVNLIRAKLGAAVEEGP